MRPKPLAGVRVLDLTRLLPGPMCTLHLADMGADVIKIEDPGAGDYARWNEPKTSKHSPFFLALNRNKRSMKLDLRQPRGVETFLRLAEGADVVVEGFRPGVVDRLGVGYEAARARNPGIVYCAVSGYGQTGPYRERAGHDINYLSYAGIADQIGTHGGPPALSNVQIADLAGGALSAAMGILAALIGRAADGAGRYVDVAMTDCSLAHAIAPLASLLAEGATPRRGGDVLSGGVPCYGFYETADGGHISLGALEPKFWRAFCDAIERPDLVEKQFARGAEADAVRAEVQAIIGTRSRDDWMPILAEADCCAAPVLRLDEAMNNEQIRARGMIVEVDNPDDGVLPQFAFPVKFSEFAFAAERAAPRHGAHSEEVLREAAFDEDTIAALKADGVI